ncbi:MAG: hypothetical protein N2Z72_04235 [Bacteroidales bacterium]|nr:hypothetical protein [Bacteroidales bacterium]
MTWTAIIFLIVLGMLLLILEFLILPGFVAGILGAISILIGVYQSYKVYGTEAGHITLISTLVAFVVLMYFVMKSKTWNRIALNNAIDSKVNEVNNVVEVGDIGVTVSKLTPSGKALIRNEIMEVHSSGEFVEKNVSVKIVKIEGYKIYVEPLKKE